MIYQSLYVAMIMLLCVACFSSASVPQNVNSDAASPVNVMNQANAQRLLDVHNVIRVSFGFNPIKWNSKLASSVQKYANSCPGLNHGGPDGWQNIAGSYLCKTKEECAKKTTSAWEWYSREIGLWDHAKKICKGGREWKECGHMVNMLSPGVTEIGCGASKCPGTPYSLVYCNYKNAEISPVIPAPPMSNEKMKAQILDANSEMWKKLKEAMGKPDGGKKTGAAVANAGVSVATFVVVVMSVINLAL